ncbi:MAG TPA: DUF4287 domain-containing protein [Trueperaceae bacterium]|nr:DUF4287 domain-containing protein [Trueperaceae bacterium]
MPDDRSQADDPFPSIAAEYGRTIEVWGELIEKSGIDSVDELRAWLEDEHGVGSEKAGALARYFLDPDPSLKDAGP